MLKEAHFSTHQPDNPLTNNSLTGFSDKPIVHHMVNNSDEQLTLVFSALSDPTRRAMLQRLVDGEMSVAELSEPFEMTKSAITKHVKVLENAGLLRRTIDGRTHYCRFSAEPIKQASDWMKFYEAFWNNKLDALDDFLTKGGTK